MNEAGEHTVIQRHAETPAAYIGDMLLMMSVQKGQYFSLNEVGSRIWELLEKPTTRPALVSQLVAEYEVTKEECDQRVTTFVSALRELQLLTDVTPADA